MLSICWAIAFSSIGFVTGSANPLLEVIGAVVGTAISAVLGAVILFTLPPSKTSLATLATSSRVTCDFTR